MTSNPEERLLHTKEIMQAEFDKLSHNAKEIVEDFDAMPYTDKEKREALNYIDARAIAIGVEGLFDQVKEGLKGLGMEDVAEAFTEGFEKKEATGIICSKCGRQVESLLGHHPTCPPQDWEGPE